MAEFSLADNSSNGFLMGLLNSEQEIVPGSQAGYQLCKDIWQYHPLGGKLVEKPIVLALSKPRILNIDAEPKEMLLKAFQKEWDNLSATSHIRDVMFLARAYGAAALIYGAEDVKTTDPIDPWDLADLRLYFNKLDPLNVAGSLISNQDPNAPDFQKPATSIAVAGQVYHPSRSVVIYNNASIYLSYQTSGFGYTGRSVFQRALYPLKSYVQSMITDNMIIAKAGLLVSKQKQAGSIVNKVMERISRIKRDYLKVGVTGNVLSIDLDESIESLDLKNTEVALKSRDNIISNIGVAADVPAPLIKDEAFTQGFGEGTEDAKAVVQYIAGIREETNSLHQFFDGIVMHRAWNKEFFEAVQNKYPELYKGKTYEQVFYSWQEAFSASWESLMEEPESEKVKIADIKLKGITDILRTIMPVSDSMNRALLIQWAQDNLNDMPEMFKSSLQVDFDALSEYEPPAGVIPTEKMPSQL